jgi:predicted RNA-binding Zn-ribbon protein involved in translation (DUF1610 family)
MDEQKAIEIITNAIQTEQMTSEQDKALSIVQKATEKQIPKQPNIWGDGYADGQLVYDMYECPGCGENYEIEYDKHDYCPKCGQRIDWRDNNGKEQTKA